MFDAVELSKATEKIVCKNSSGNLRKYYRFRPAAFYGGIATADCVGCNLRCIFCWAWNVVNNSAKIGNFYSPEEVAEKLVGIAKKKGFSQIRISGNEPTIGKKHLLKILGLIPPSFHFILETNGILIGHDADYAKQLSKFDNLHVRVSLKGTNEEEFSKLSGAYGASFNLQLNSLRNLVNEDVSCHAALIEIAKADLRGLKAKLKSIDAKLENIEIEPLIAYPAVKARLAKGGLSNINIFEK